MTQATLADNLTTVGEQRPPMRTDVFYALTTLGSTTIWSVLNGWLLYFYVPPGGTPRVPAALYGVLVLVVRCVNIVLDPPIGYLSDHTHSRWGRRLPFMFASALPLLIFFVLLWAPPAPGQSMWNLIYLAILLSLYNIAYSFGQIPYEALLPELALTEQHRVRISTWYASFQLIGMILGGFVGMLIDNVGYLTAALIYAGGVLPTFYLPFLVLRERPGRQIAAAQQLNFWRSLSVTLRNRPFLSFAGIWMLYWSTMTITQAAIPFITTEICLLSEADTIYLYVPAVLASLACYPLVMRLADRLGKGTVFLASLLASSFVFPCLLLIGEWLPAPLNVQGIIWSILQAVAVSGVIVLTPAFTAEITDYDETLTGQRREGAYYSTLGLLDHLVTGAASALLPLLLLLGRSHTDPAGPLGVRMVGVASGVMMLAAFLLFLRYPLRRPRGELTKGVH